MPSAMQILAFIRALFLPRTLLALESLALRQQVAVFRSSVTHLGGLHHSYRRAA